jgi:hypothetical protein
MYVTARSETFPLSPKDRPRLRTAYRKRGDFIVKNFVIVTPAHLEVPPRNWAIHAPKDMEKCGDLDPPSRMLENTVFHGVFSNPWHHDQVAQDYDYIIKTIKEV